MRLHDAEKNWRRSTNLGKNIVRMSAPIIKNLRHTLTRTRLRNALLLLLLVAALVAVFLNCRTVAEIPTDGPCGSCHTLETRSENFDSVTPPALPPDWLATNALGPPPLWVTSNNGVITPP